MGYNDLWKPPKDMISNIYYHPSAKGKKKARSTKRRHRNREYFLKYFGLHETTSSAVICSLIAEKLGWEMPGMKNQYNRFMSKAYAKLKNKQKAKKSHQSKFKDSDEFYKSKEWKELRYIALRNSEGKCNLCGARSSDGVQIHVDHIKPRSKFPQYELDLNNLQVLCSDCNIGKSNHDDTNWKQHWESI